jgi:3-hydroxyacyl-[acyl-carrier-protein] dehydratase
MLLNGLFEIINKNNNNLSFKIKLSDESHPIFKAHFPNNPILPGFIQIDISKHLFNLNIIKIKKAKFLSLVKPNDIIDIDSNIDKKKILISKNSKKVSEFIYE